MCQVNASLLSEGSEKEIMQDIQILDIHGDNLILKDLFGEEKRLQARVRRIDLASHKILIEEI